MQIPDSGLVPFSERYKMTEFRLEIGAYDAITISEHRADDIRAWWTERGLPVVLRSENRHLVPKEDFDMEYNIIRIPDYMASDDWEEVEAFLVPDADATRRVAGGMDAV